MPLDRLMNVTRLHARGCNEHSEVHGCSVIGITDSQTLLTETYTSSQKGKR